MRYIDISPSITEELAVFPGDTPFSRHVSLDITAGDNIKLSSITTTVHIGAHADAPNHYAAKGKAIAECSLEYYLGHCQVITVTSKHQDLRIHLEDIENIIIKAPRILFRTLSYPNPTQWNDDFLGLSPEVIGYLASFNVITVGIDTPSIDPSASKLLESHQAVNTHNMAILEGLILKDVADGTYELIALPLKIKDAEASPVRAILCAQS